MLAQTRGIAITNFFGSLHYFLTVFILSPYLAQFMGESAVGLVFSAGALVALVGFLVFPWVLRKISLKTAAIVIACVQFVTLIGLTFSPPLTLLVPLVITLAALPPLISYTLDIFLEHATKSEGNTGNIRGFFITVGNVALVISPLAVGFVLGDTNQYEKIFALAAATLLPLILLVLAVLKSGPREENVLSLKSTLKCLIQSRDVLLGSGAHFVMLLFFSWVAIYIPLYLHTELGIPWESLGWVFSIMLLPYIILEYPLGVIADKWFGERELMLSGFAVMGIAMALISFITSPLITLFLVAVLVLTRVGGAMAEITTETYFFKHVDGDDVNSISLFRMLRPIGTIIGPLIGSFALLFISLQSLFIVLGALCFLGIPLAFLLKNTR